MGNQQGKERRDYGKKLEWKSAERPSSPGKPYLVPGDSGKFTDVITIRWSPPEIDGGAPLIGYLVEHRRTGSPHWLRATPDLVLNTELPLTGLEPGWRYQFRVSAENGLGRSDPGELSEPLTVTPQKWAISAPFFNLELQDTIGLENEKVEFKVQVIAIPPPTLAWYKDGFEVFSSRRTKIITENDQSTFIIHQAALEDEGEIKCTATNRAGHAVTKAHLKLEAPPRIRLPRQYEEGLIFEKGELIRLKVTTAGRPKPDVFWYHDGELLQKNERIEISASETGSVVKIRDACRDDRGEYSIKGVNKIGEDVISFLVTVTDRPSPPGKIQVNLLGRMVTLSWSNPDDDGGCKIGSYIVEYFRIGWDIWLKARNSRQLSTILEDLIEGSEYKFRVRAENPYGISDPSEESNVIFIPDPKRGIIKPPPKLQLSEIFKEPKSHAENTQNTEEAERRRLLEEKAKKLLDTPLSALLPPEKLSRKAEENNDDTSPPVTMRRKEKGRLTPTPVNGTHTGVEDKSRKTYSSVYNNLGGTKKVVNGVTENSDRRLNSMEFKGQDPFCEGPLYPRENDDSIVHGSSELMLVIYPSDTSKSVELGAEESSDNEINLACDGVAPPMSLSAPELGGADIYEIPPLRNAISSTELLPEKTAARLYQDSMNEEAQRCVKRRYSMDRKSMERRTSLKQPVEKRLSFKESQTETGEEKKQMEELQSKIPKPLRKTPSERLNSVERERLEFAMVRERLKQKEEQQKALKMGTDESETSTLTATSSSVETEEPEDDYEEESLEEEEEENYLDEEKREKNDDYEDEILNFKSELPAIDISLALIKITPFVEREEDTYHPRSMIPTRSVFKQLPADKVNIKTEPIAPQSQFEKPPSPLQPGHPKHPEQPKTPKIPVLSKTRKTSKILKKLGLKKDKKIPKVTLTPPDQDSTSTALPKPILKNKIPTKKKESPKTLLKFTHIKPIDKSISEEESESEFTGKKKKQVRISEPNDEVQKTKNEKLVDENARENQVLIFHYSDIVKEFGTIKKPLTKLYLNYDELKAHAGEFEKVNSFSQQNGSKHERIITNQNTSVADFDQEPKPEVSTSKESKIGSPQPKPKALSSLEYLQDVVMFIVACCLYMFKNELYAIPILAIMVYRQLKEATIEKYKNLRNLLSKIIPERLKGKTENERNASTRQSFPTFRNRSITG